MVKSLIINLRVYKYRVYLFSNFHLISSCTIETKVISTFLRIFSVQKIENSFVVLITRLTCQSSSRKIYENFTYIVYVYIYILEKIGFTWKNISACRVFHVRRILRLLRISRTSHVTRGCPLAQHFRDGGCKAISMQPHGGCKRSPPSNPADPNPVQPRIFGFSFNFRVISTRLKAETCFFPHFSSRTL